MWVSRAARARVVSHNFTCILIFQPKQGIRYSHLNTRVAPSLLSPRELLDPEDTPMSKSMCACLVLMQTLQCVAQRALLSTNPGPVRSCAVRTEEACTRDARNRDYFRMDE